MRKMILLLFSLTLITSMSVGCSGDNKEQSTMIETLRQDSESAHNQVNEQEELITEQKKHIENLEQVIKQLEEQTLTEGENDFSVTMGNIAIGDWDDQLKLSAMLGEPLSEETHELENADTFTGSLVKELNYEGIQLTLFSPKGGEKFGEAFWIYEMVITGEQFQTPRGIKVGDHIDELREAYPTISLALDGRSTENNGVYQLSDNDYNFLKFKIDNGIITSIHILREFP